MGISKKQYALIAKAGSTREKALEFLKRAGREPSPEQAYDKVGQLLKGKDVATAFESSVDGIKPIEQEVSDTQPKVDTPVPTATPLQELLKLKQSIKVTVG